MSWRSKIGVAIVCLAAGNAFTAAAAFAQTDSRVDVGVQLNTLRLGEFDTTDVGIGVEGAWRIAPLLAIDGALSWLPGNGDDGAPQVEDQGRLLGLIGVRSGVQRGPVEVFGRVRPGFLRFSDESPVPCILIFPPPLTCQVLGGKTTFVTEIGGGLRFSLGQAQRAYISFDIGDLLVRYDGPAIRPDGSVSDDGFVSHNLLTSVGVGWRF